MAKIDREGGFGDISGQMGDYIISRKGNKKNVRQKRKKKNNHTKPRVKTESRFKELSHIWTGLSISEKRAWFDLFTSGHKFKNKKEEDIADTRNLFISLNLTKQEIEEPINRTAPAYADSQNLFSAEVEMLLKDGNLSMNLHLLTEIEPDTKVIIYATPSITNPSKYINKRNYRSITVLDSNFVSGSSILDPYLKVFGKTGGVGEEFGFKWRPVNKHTGIRGIQTESLATIISLDNQ